MTIKRKLMLNSCIIVIAVAAVLVSSYFSMNSIREKLHYLTQKSTPYQVCTLEFQRALQEATANLTEVAAAANEAQYATAKANAERSLEGVKKTQLRLEELSAERLDASNSFAETASELYGVMQRRLKAEKESARLHGVIVVKGGEASRRIQELESKVKSLQQASSSAYAVAGVEADKISKNLASIETLKSLLKDARYALGDYAKAPERKQNYVTASGYLKKLQQNSNIRSNKKIAAKYTLFTAAAEQLLAIKDLSDSKRNEAMLADAVEKLADIEDLIEDEVDRSQLQVSTISGQLQGHMKRANGAVSVLSSSTELVSAGKTLEGLSARLFLASNVAELEQIAAEFERNYQRLTGAERAIAGMLKAVGADKELQSLQVATKSLGEIRALVQAESGVLALLRQKLQLQIMAEQETTKLREVVAKQAEKGRSTLSLAQGEQAQAITGVNKTIRASILLILGIAVAAVLFGTVFGLWIYRSIITPIGCLIASAEKIADGDLTVKLVSDGGDEVGQVQVSMARMLDSVKAVIERIGGATDSLVGSSEEMAGTALQLETGAASQQDRVDGAATTLEQMAATTIDIAQKTAETARVADTVSSIAQEGKSVMQQTAHELGGFAVSFTDAVTMVDRLGEQSHQINEIGSLIRDIADQTNLLALNAAIEAARAGEQGRGFAVVADNIRGLAERTSTATTDITKTVQEMQTSVSASVRQMDLEKTAVSAILERIERTVASIDSIAEHVQQVADMVRQIATATEEQSVASSTAANNVDDIAALTREMSGACSSIRASSEGLSHLASDLNGLVSWFKVH